VTGKVPMVPAYPPK